MSFRLEALFYYTTLKGFNNTNHGRNPCMTHNPEAVERSIVQPLQGYLHH
jgi:hypothetical protein